METPYAIEMLHITKRFPGIVANDDITLQLRKGEIHALLGENGAGKSTLMSVLFGLYQAEEGIIKKDGVEVQIKDPNDANALGIGMMSDISDVIYIKSGTFSSLSTEKIADELLELNRRMRDENAPTYSSVPAAGVRRIRSSAYPSSGTTSPKPR